MVKDYASLMQRLAYEFKDITLLQTALTHRSVSRDNNERLEFIGDAILNFIIAEALFRQFPQTLEGELSRCRAGLVKGDTLSELAREFGLGDYLKLGPGELKSGGNSRRSILSDSVEAIIAAIYLDAGFTTCQSVVNQWFAQRLVEIEPSEVTNKDPKTQLQEVLQANRYALPIYVVMATTGDAHAQRFEVECQVPGLALKTHGEGTSRRRAEQLAAQAFLDKLK